MDLKYILIECTLLTLMILRESASTCEITRFERLNNCSFLSHANPRHSHLLTMIVPYALNSSEEDHLLISILRHPRSMQPLIRLNLNLIQCNHSSLTESIQWNSLESSSTLTGEFLRTNRIEQNRMYFPSGTTYLRNLTMIDCSSKTIYQSEKNEIFQLDLRIESTLNDSCHSDEQCYPSDRYRCDSMFHRCRCREPYQSYSIDHRIPICVETVEHLSECQQTQARCFPWCRENNASTLCVCPEKFTEKIISTDHRAFCQSRTNQICNEIFQCSTSDECRNGFCRSRREKFVEVTVIIGCSILSLISFILALLLCFTRCRRKTTSNPMDARSYRLKDGSSAYTYQPTVVYLGGEEELTAIFA